MNKKLIRKDYEISMTKYEIGQIYPEFANHKEYVKFDISDEGAVMIVCFDKPTRDEVEQFKAGSSFEMRFTTIYDIMMMTAKIGSLTWMDAPYSPHLSQNLTTFSFPQTDEGLALTLMLFDSSNGKLMHQRLIGLGEKFFKKLLETAMELKMTAFDKSEYDKKLNSIYARYDTKTIVKMSRDYYKIN